jgi:hypothetical protein
MTHLAISNVAAPAICTPKTNALGTKVMTTTALNQINPQLQSGVDAGTTNVMTQLLGLDDLTGVADPNGLSIGVIDATTDPAKGAWPGAAPIDWWFLADPTSVGANGLPTQILGGGTLAARNLVAGPGDISLNLLLGGSPAVLKMRSARVIATLNGTPAPNVPAPPPAQLAAGLTVFQTVTGDGTGQGLCGDITVDSLAQIPVPDALAQGGGTPCSGTCTNSHAYTSCGGGPVTAACNSLLDLIVGGCKVAPFGCLLAVTAVNPTQPDVAGTDGDIDALSLGAANKVPSGQTTGNDDSYSAYLTFQANRAHLTGETCTATTTCQAGQTCVAGLCQ